MREGHLNADPFKRFMSLYNPLTDSPIYHSITMKSPTTKATFWKRNQSVRLVTAAQSQLSIRVVERNDALDVAGRIENLNLTLSESMPAAARNTRRQFQK